LIEIRWHRICHGATARIRRRSSVVRRSVACDEFRHREPGHRLVTDGEPAAIAEGHGTIRVELLRAGTLDTVVVQVGDGALISGIARWVKEHSPETRVAGVCASGARAMRLSIDGGRPIRTEAPRTIAGGLAISEPVVASFDRVLALVGELVLVDDDDIRAAMVVIADTLGGLVEALGRRRRRRCPQAPFAG
jgi:threonine dehydratase